MPRDGGMRIAGTGDPVILRGDITDGMIHSIRGPFTTLILTGAITDITVITHQFTDVRLFMIQITGVVLAAI